VQSRIAKVVSLPEAARKLGISYERAARMLFTGRLRGEMFAGRWLIDVTSLEAEQAKGSVLSNVPESGRKKPQ
jgi:hypothetical protein